jgi:excisionase family DNA binding protein
MQSDTTAITVRHAAERLKVSERFVSKLIADRRLPSFKLGRRRLIREAALADYLTRLETVAR